MREEDGLSSSSTKLFLAALVHFFSINDVMINRKKISKFLGDSENKYEYRSYTIDEISKILSVQDERGKAAVLLLASTGMRVGGLSELRLKHLKRWNLDSHSGNINNYQYIYQIKVYASSNRSKYITFCTPECAKAIDEYLEMRQRYGEHTLKQDPQTGNWLPGETPLIIKQFDKNSFSYHKILPVEPNTITDRIVVPKLLQLGIRRKIMVTGSKTKSDSAKIKHEVHPCHSFRIFAISQMQRARLDKTIREMLVGHSTGLDAVYYKAQDYEIFEEYLKAVDFLTISNEHRLKKQLSDYKQKSEGLAEIQKQLNKKYEQKMKAFEDEMAKKFQHLLAKIDTSKI